MDQAIEYSQNRKQFGKSISQFQNIQFKLADMSTDLVTSRLIVREAASVLDDENATAQDKMVLASMAKKHATDSCFDVYDSLI